jgi:predicted transcriptional regulator
MTYKAPCEQIVWDLLPAIRKEMTISLIKQHKMTQKEAAEKLGLSEAAVSRYISGKRGGLDISLDTIQKEINKSTKQIIKGDKKTVITETCQVCKLLQKNNILEKLANRS